MWSVVLGLLLKGYKSYRTYVFIVAAVSLLSGAGLFGYKLSSWRTQAEQARILEEVIVKYKKDLETSRKASEDLRIEHTKIENRTKLKLKSIEDYVKAHPAVSNCKLDDDGLLLWNN